MKTNKTLIKELLRDLHYHQMMVRVDLRAACAGIRKCKELGQQMRDLQSGKVVEHAVLSKKADPQPEVLPIKVVGIHQLPLI